MAAVLTVDGAGDAAPRNPLSQAVQRLRAAEAALDQAYRVSNATPGKDGLIRLEWALAAYYAAREAVYGKPVDASAATGSFDGSIPEVEPNGTAPTAHSLDPVLAQEGAAVVVGEIRAIGDQDYFSFTAEAGMRAWVYADTGGPVFPGSASTDTVVTLFDRDQTTVLEVDDDDGTGNGRDTTVESARASVIAGRPLPATGTYYLRVEEFGNSDILSPYRLYVVLTPSSGGNESEANDTLATADTLLPVGARVGQMNGAATGGDLDAYRLALQAGDVVTLQLDENPGRDANQSRCELALIDPAGNALLSSIHNSPSSVQGGEGFGFRAVTAGIYFVGVRQTDAGATASDYQVLAAVVSRTTGATSLIHGNLGSGSLDYPGISGTQVGRLFRNAVASNCENGPKPFPGGSGDGTNPHAFDAYVFKNRSGKEACVEVTLTAYDSTQIHGCIYATFDPGDHQPGYLGDSGNSSLDGTRRAFSVKVAAGAVFVVSLSDVNANSAVGKPYTLSVTGDFRSSLVGGPADMTVPNDPNQAGATVNYNPPFPSDPSLGPVVCTPPPGSFFPIGTTQVTCRDQGGNTHTFNITVKDVQPPVIVAPASVTVAQNQAGGAIVNYQASTGDNAPGAGLVCTPAPGSFFPLGGSIVTCVATDAAGNVTTKAFLITVTVPASTAGTRIAASGSIATGTPAATFKATGSVAADGTPKLTVTYTQKTAGQALKATIITGVTRNNNTVRIFGKMKNGTNPTLLDFMLELVDNGKTRPPSDTVRLDIRNGFQLATTVIKTGDISIKP